MESNLNTVFNNFKEKILSVSNLSLMNLRIMKEKAVCFI